MLDQNVSIGTRTQVLWATTLGLIKQALPACGAYMAAMVVLGSIVEIAGVAEGTGVSMGLNVAGLFAGFMLTRVMLDQAGLTTGGSVKGFGSYFGLSILTGLATVFGMLLLIVPGILLLIRWLPVFGFLMGAGEDVTVAMSSSWQRTKGHFWALLVGALPLLGIILVAAIAYGVADEPGTGPASLWYVIANIGVYGLSLLWTAYGIAAFALLKDNRDELSGVFG